MVIKSLKLKDFRNYSDFESGFHPSVNIIYGKNGQGKTNLIESIYFSTHLKSFRTPRLDDLSKNLKFASSLSVSLLKQDVLHNIKINLQENLKQVIHNGKKVHYASDYIKFFYSLLFAPDLLTAFKEFPLERRNFFDRIILLLNDNYFKKIKEFSRIKKQKNHLLKQGKKAEIASWNQLLARLIPEVVHTRQKLVDEINGYLTDVFQTLTEKTESLKLVYRNDFENRSEAGVEEIFKFLNRKIDLEIGRGHSLYGPHKDNYFLIIDNEKKGQFFSQGEYRTAFLALQLAINEIILAQLTFNPVLLLDDIFSELDRDICYKIVEYVKQKKNQVFITSTEIPDSLKNTGYAYEIENGCLI